MLKKIVCLIWLIFILSSKVIAVQGLHFNLSNDGAYYTVYGVSGSSNANLVIPSEYNGIPVTKIGGNAFSYNSQITSVTLPNSIIEIGALAFRECTSLESINLPEGLKKISDTAFGACRSLNSITLPSTLEIIELYAFSRCSSLVEVSIPPSVISMGRSIFFDCQSLETVYFFNNFTTLPEYIFESSSAIKNIFFAHNVEVDLNSNSFYGIQDLPQINYLNNENYYFEYISGNFNWEEAKSDAEVNGGRLAVINTIEKINFTNSYLQGLGSDKHSLIGLRLNGENNVWEWINGESLTISDWVRANHTIVHWMNRMEIYMVGIITNGIVLMVTLDLVDI